MKKALFRKKIMRVFYKIVYYIDYSLLCIIKLLGNVIGQKDFSLNMMLPFCEAVEKTSDSYVTCKFRQKRSEDVPVNTYCNKKITERLAIVVQGPIVGKNDFTLETIKTYLRIFPGISIILSTWENAEKGYIEEIEKLENCYVVLNHEPEFPGNLNLNYQITTTMGGLLLAKKLNKEFVLKIRSDMRVCSSGIIEYMYHLLQENPCFCNNGTQKFRILVFNAYVYRPYNVSDFYCFGNTEDLISYWNMPLQTCKSEPGYKMANLMEAEKWTYRRVFESKLTPEIEITRNYVERIYGHAECSLREYWNVLKDRFLVLEHRDLDVLWLKYDYNREENFIQKTYIRNIYGGEREAMKIFTFSMWRDLIESKFEVDTEVAQKYLDQMA